MMKTLISVATLLVNLCLLSTASAQDKKLTPVTVAYSATSGTFSPLWVAADQGLFAKHGLDVRMTYIQGIAFCCRR
jgi:ABC-type nitrate/sulfonate/bicarbonate transport system substrate-binding protein